MTLSESFNQLNAARRNDLGDLQSLREIKQAALDLCDALNAEAAERAMKQNINTAVQQARAWDGLLRQIV